MGQKGGKALSLCYPTASAVPKCLCTPIQPFSAHITRAKGGELYGGSADRL